MTITHIARDVLDLIGTGDQDWAGLNAFQHEALRGLEEDGHVIWSDTAGRYVLTDTGDALLCDGQIITPPPVQRIPDRYRDDFVWDPKSDLPA